MCTSENIQPYYSNGRDLCTVGVLNSQCENKEASIGEGCCSYYYTVVDLSAYDQREDGQRCVLG